MFKTLVVADNDLLLAMPSINAITFDSYLRDYPKLNERKTRIINLCDTEHYLSRGYYCSLLAEAREHKVMPSIRTINEMRSNDGELEITLPNPDKWQDIEEQHIGSCFNVYFGLCQTDFAAKLSKRIFQLYQTPCIRVTITGISKKQLHISIAPLSPASLDQNELSIFVEAFNKFTSNQWKTRNTKQFRWSMAILVDPDEKLPPSDRDAISRFVRAARKLGIAAETVSNNDIHTITHYDALFIRETTAIDHHTYRLAARAEKEGLVVMDDASSILRCCNKVFLQDAFSYQKVPCIKTEVISDSRDETLDMLENTFGFPMILKMPEGSFSRGVYKVNNRIELGERLEELFQETALVLAQEFMYTDYDWRIGVLNGKALYACKYFMVRNHWQIYNHAKKRAQSGGFETLPTFEVPKAVLNAALKAAKICGNGLYGVDIKFKDGNAYVLEVNDNPSIDHGVEDVFLGDELYMLVMSEFLRRLELRGK